MASAQASSPLFRICPVVALAAVLLAALSPVDAQTQPAAPQSQSIQFLSSFPAGRLAFLNGYAGRTTKEVMKDKQFKVLMKLMIPRTEYHYGRDMPLAEAVDTVLSESPLPVNIRDGRFVTVMGMQGPYLHGRGFLWFDLQDGVALGGFYFTPTNGEPTPTLTIFSRQLKETSLALSELPRAFVDDLSQWSAVPVFPRSRLATSSPTTARNTCWSTTRIIVGIRRERRRRLRRTSACRPTSMRRMPTWTRRTSCRKRTMRQMQPRGCSIRNRLRGWRCGTGHAWVRTGWDAGSALTRERDARDPGAVPRPRPMQGSR